MQRRKPRNKHNKVQLVLGWKSVPGTAIAQKGNESFLREEEVVAFQAENAAAAKARKQKQLRYTHKCRLSGEHMVGETDHREETNLNSPPEPVILRTLRCYPRMPLTLLKRGDLMCPLERLLVWKGGRF